MGEKWKDKDKGRRGKGEALDDCYNIGVASCTAKKPGFSLAIMRRLRRGSVGNLEGNQGSFAARCAQCW